MPVKFLYRRIFPGFRVGEMLLWMLFHISWPLLLTIVHNATGKFNNVNFMSFSQFASIQAFVISGKALSLLPFWWFYFIKLKTVSLPRKMALHVFTSFIYVALCIGFLYLSLHYILQVSYSRNDMISDIYNLLLTYFLHFTLFHAYNFWLNTKEQLKKEQAFKELAYQSEIKALKSQIEPHFLFNTLNSISASVPPNLEKTRVMIAQLADTFRHALYVSERQFVTLKEEIEFLKNWLSLEKHRFDDRLNVIFDLDREVMRIQIPPMVLQPLIENALKHGINPKLSGGTVTIQCKRKGEFAEIAISDTGVGYEFDLNQMFTEGVGLSNVYKRLQMLYNQTLNVERNTEGLRFYFRVPLAKTYEKESLYLYQ